jgi:hypothetical protein
MDGLLMRIPKIPGATAWEEVRNLGIYVPQDMTSAGRLIVTRFARVYYSDDEGANMTVISRTPGVIETFPTTVVAARVAGDGSVVVWVADSTVWHGTIGGAFSQVLTIDNGYPLITYGTHVYENFVFCNEYGSGSYPNAYLSTDYGASWTKVFTMPARVDFGANHHMHAVAYDSYQDILWAVYGDTGNRGISYSTDTGANWTALAAPGVMPDNMIQVIPLPECVLFLTDSSPTGVHRLTRKSSKVYTSADVSFVFNPLPGLPVGGFPIGSRPLVQYGSEARAYFSFTYFDSDAANEPLGHMYATWDGSAFHDIASAASAPSGTAPFGMIILLGIANGYLYASFDKGDSGETLIKMAEPVWTGAGAGPPSEFRVIPGGWPVIVPDIVRVW